jgi:hypothetical protein
MQWNKDIGGQAGKETNLPNLTYVDNNDFADVGELILCPKP